MALDPHPPDRLPPAASDPSRDAGDPVGGTGCRVLAVEDDDAVLRLIERLLSSRGFQVSKARSLAGARALISDQPVDLVLADYVLPDGHGTDILSSPPGHGPALVLMSGYGAAHLRSAGVAPDIPVLDKPFSGSTVLAAVRAALDGRATRESDEPPPSTP